MAVVRSSLASIEINQGKPNQTAVFPQLTSTTWVRNSEWIALTAPGSSEQKFVGIFAVYDNNSNYLRVNCAGNYTVDWGDGTSANFTANANAEKQYTFSSIDAGTQTTQGYRQVLVTITPQAGQNLTKVDLNLQHTRTNMRGYLRWLDIAVASPNLTNFAIAYSNSSSTLERVNVVSSAITNAGGIFRNLFALQSVTFNTTGTLTSTSEMFRACRQLQVAPFFNTGSVTNMSYMFYDCYNLVSVPEYNTGSVTNMFEMFRYCYKLRYLPAFNTSNVTSIESIAYDCYSLVELPTWNLSKVTNANNAFVNTAITKIPNFNFAALTTATSMFNGCYNLKTLPNMVFPVLTNATNMFANCTNLERVDTLTFNASGATNLTSLFDACYRLKTVTSISAVNCTNATNLFARCYSLNKIDALSFGSNLTNSSYMFYQCMPLSGNIPLFTTSSVTNAQGMFGNMYSLQTLPNFNFSAVTNIQNMFENCYGLISLPTGITWPTAATNTTSMFIGCQGLVEPPAINTSSATAVQNMFLNCYGLVRTPTTSFASVNSATGQSGTFEGCISLSTSTVTGTRFTISYQNDRLAGAQLDTIYTNLATLNPAVTNASGNGTTVTYTVGTLGIPAFVAGRTVTITGVDPVAYNLTGVTVASVNAGAGTFTVTNAATGTYVSGGVASITSDRTITVTGNHGTPDDTPSIATNKGWTVTGS